MNTRTKAYFADNGDFFQVSTVARDGLFSVIVLPTGESVTANVSADEAAQALAAFVAEKNWTPA